MQYSPLQLKEKLLEGIDNENNVVDMPKVLQVICILEQFPVTREILEETRIGRLINDVRRKTTDKQLAKRAKELVRSWQKLVNSVQESSATVNGEGVNSGATPNCKLVNKPIVSPAGSIGKSASATIPQRILTPNSVKSSLSPGQPRSKPNTPSLPNVNNKHSLQHAAKRSNSSPHLLASSKRACLSPSVSQELRPGSPDSLSSQSSRTSSTVLNNDQSVTTLSHPSTINTADSARLRRTHSSESLPVKQRHSDIREVQSASSLSPALSSGTNAGQNGVTSKTVFNGGTETPTHSIETKGLKTTIRFNRTSPPVPINGIVETPKKRGRGRPPKVKTTSPNGQPLISPPTSAASNTKSFSDRKNASKLSVDTDTIQKDKFVSLTPKVKSTAELIQSLQAKNSLSVGKDTARKIQSNLIQKESDEFQSVVPDGAKPRQHRKKGSRTDAVPPSTPVSLKTKTEMVQKFLESSVTQSSPDDLSPLKYELPRTESPENASTSFEDSIEGNHESNSKHNLTNQPNDFDQTNSKTVISEGPSVLRKDYELEPKPGSSKEPDKEKEPLTLEEIYSQYPPLDLDNFVLEDGNYEPPEPLEITDTVVERVHSEHWEGVNGCNDAWGSWKDWTQTLTRQSYNSDHLHILPYVIVDD